MARHAGLLRLSFSMCITSPLRSACPVLVVTEATVGGGARLTTACAVEKWLTSTVTVLAVTDVGTSSVTAPVASSLPEVLELVSAATSRDELLAICERAQLPLFATRESSAYVIDLLRAYLSKHFAERTSMLQAEIERKAELEGNGQFSDEQRNALKTQLGVGPRPHKYLIDIDGFIVYDHIGEGGYAETEAEIQRLLRERAQVVGWFGAGGMRVAHGLVSGVWTVSGSGRRVNR